AEQFEGRTTLRLVHDGDRRILTADVLPVRDLSGVDGNDLFILQGRDRIVLVQDDADAVEGDGVRNEVLLVLLEGTGDQADVRQSLSRVDGTRPASRRTLRWCERRLCSTLTRSIRSFTCCGRSSSAWSTASRVASPNAFMMSAQPEGVDFFISSLACTDIDMTIY